MGRVIVDMLLLIHRSQDVQMDGQDILLPGQVFILSCAGDKDDGDQRRSGVRFTSMVEGFWENSGVFGKPSRAQAAIFIAAQVVEGAQLPARMLPFNSLAMKLPMAVRFSRCHQSRQGSREYGSTTSCRSWSSVICWPASAGCPG